MCACMRVYVFPHFDVDVCSCIICLLPHTNNDAVSTMTCAFVSQFSVNFSFRPLCVRVGFAGKIFQL